MKVFNSDTVDADVIIGGIIKHTQGYGFKITFTQHTGLDMDYYKQNIIDYFKTKQLRVSVENGYHDKKE